MNPNISSWDEFEDSNKYPRPYWPVALSSKVGYDISVLNKIPEPSQSQSPFLDFSNGEIKNLKQELKEIKKVVGQLAEKMKSLESDYIEIRDIPYAQAKDEIAKYFKEHNGENIDPADIEENLGIDFDMAFAVCEELEKEGKIKGI
jgi:predicted transcriptional regulator